MKLRVRFAAAGIGCHWTYAAPKTEVRSGPSAVAKNDVSNARSALKAPLANTSPTTRNQPFSPKIILSFTLLPKDPAAPRAHPVRAVNPLPPSTPCTQGPGPSALLQPLTLVPQPSPDPYPSERVSRAKHRRYLLARARFLP